MNHSYPHDLRLLGGVTRPEDLTHKFRALLDAFTQMVAEANLEVKPYTGDGPRHFQTLPAEMQAAVLHNFARYAEVCSQTIRDGKSITDDTAFLWRFIRHMQWRQTSDLFSLFEKEDVIEVYDLSSFVQIFRNLRFFTVCSYTLDDILCRPFWELYRRDEAITAKIVETATKVAQQEITSALEYDSGVYTIEEIDSPMLYQCHVENRFIAPLLNANGQTVAAVHVMRCHAKITKADPLPREAERELDNHR